MMHLLPNIQQLIDDNRLDEAMKKLNCVLADDDTNDEAFFMRGKLFWRLQKYSDAVTDFEHAVAINPKSGAVYALDLARDVFNFYNPDLLNP